jgi:hypothetical protein
MKVAIKTMSPVGSKGGSVGVRHRETVIVAREGQRVLPDRGIVLRLLKDIAVAKSNRIATSRSSGDIARRAVVFRNV